MNVELPRHVIPKKLASGKTAFYYNLPTRYRKMDCPVPNEPLGSDYAKACGAEGRAATLNGLFDEWMDALKGLPVSSEAAPRIGTIDWLFREYRQSRAYLEKVKPRSRRNYEWNMREICDTLTKRGDRVGAWPIKSVTPLGADKLYDTFVKGRKGNRLRTAEKLVVLCRKAWRVVHRLHPAEFPSDIPNPWLGVTMATRVKLVKHAVTREQAYKFAHGCVERGEPECGAAAVICFEWLQRPENVIAGHIKWTDYRTGPKPTIRIEHHKTGAVIDHPLEDQLPSGEIVKFYEEAESVLAKLTRRGVPMILREIVPKRRGSDEGKKTVFKPYSFSGMQKIVQRMRKEIGLPEEFTLDACRHGGMTELEEAELTEGQGRALSAHRTRESYAGYAKRTEARMLSATRKRHAHMLANQAETDVQNKGRTAFRMPDRTKEERSDKSTR
ncbi:hypothetical protein AAFG07_11235 [Bradyrhizobium sp. B097]|uniref:hypothetical protein n=1 Tax=Bradyrhizobium sp. B097 TaxID=3140244 RepID=UPI0031831FC0